MYLSSALQRESKVRSESMTSAVDSLAKLSTIECIDDSLLENGLLSNSSTLDDLPWPTIPDSEPRRACSPGGSPSAREPLQPLSPGGSPTARRMPNPGRRLVTTLEQDALKEQQASPQSGSSSDPLAPRVPSEPLQEKTLFGRPVSLRAQVLKSAPAQKCLKARLADLNPSDFQPDAVAICMTMSMEVPSAFSEVSYNIKFHRGLALLQAKDVQLVRDSSLLLMFCDILDDQQLKLARHMCSYVASLGAEAPRVVLVPHCSDPAQEERPEDETVAAMSNAMDSLPMVATVLGQPAGFKLLGEVQSQLMIKSKRSRQVDAHMNKHRSRVDYSDKLRHNIEVMVWEYFSFRLGLPIPPQDCSIACEPGALIGNFKVGAELGSGSCGKVFRLDAHGGSPRRMSRTSCQVVKMIPKQDNESFRGLSDLCNEVNIMQMLDHPNIIKLHEVYNTETHILLRMEDGGTQNLYQYLRRLECKRMPLSPLKAERIVLQSISAICHMHVGPGIAHRDIKPENIVAREKGQGVIEIKICDFDLSRICGDSHCLCQSVCGTFPFMAPEIGEGPYLPFPTDIWSMAIVFLEVVCCCKVLTKAVSFHNSTHNGDRAPADRPDIDIAMIRNFFEDSANLGMMVDRYLKPEFRGLMNHSMPTLLEDMLCVEVAQRVTALDLRDVGSWPEGSLFSNSE